MPLPRSNVLIYLVRKYPQANAILCSTSGIPEKYRKVLKCWVGIKALLGSPIFRCTHHPSRCENRWTCKYHCSNPCQDMEGSLWVGSSTFFSQMVLSPHGVFGYSLQKLSEASSFLSLRNRMCAAASNDSAGETACLKRCFFPLTQVSFVCLDNLSEGLNLSSLRADMRSNLPVCSPSLQ